MNTSHWEVKKPRYSLSLYLNPGNLVVCFSGWRKLSFLSKLGWCSWAASCPKRVLARTVSLISTYYIHRVWGIMGDWGEPEVKTGRVDKKEGEGRIRIFELFPKGVQIKVTNRIHCLTDGAWGVRRKLKVWPHCKGGLKNFVSYRFQTITGKFQDNTDLESTAYSEKLI